jgi:hypothetical protein
MIAISPGAKERIMVMDRLRHHGSPKRLLPRVTVEEVDDAELTVPSEEDESTEASEPDAGVALSSERAP